MPYTEIPVFMARLREHEAVSARLLEFKFLTVARSKEAYEAIWDEIDLERAIWTLPQSAWGRCIAA